jgi:hypothetical protein
MLGRKQQQQHNTNQTKLEMPNWAQGAMLVAAPRARKYTTQTGISSNALSTICTAKLNPIN